MLSRRRPTGDVGSTMILMPLGVLIVLLLAAIAFDLSWVQEAQHEAIDAAESAANDAVTFGVDQSGHGVHLDDDRVVDAVDRSLAAHQLKGFEPDRTTVVTDRAAGTITVTITCHVDYVFARAIPGASRGREVTASGTARLVER
jgi:hypothetical protein